MLVAGYLSSYYCYARRPKTSLMFAFVCSLMSDQFCNASELRPIRLFCPWDFPGKDTGVGSHFLFQGIFPTQGLNPQAVQFSCRQVLYHRLTWEAKTSLNLLIKKKTEDRCVTYKRTPKSSR